MLWEEISQKLFMTSVLAILCSPSKFSEALYSCSSVNLASELSGGARYQFPLLRRTRVLPGYFSLPWPIEKAVFFERFPDIGKDYLRCFLNFKKGCDPPLRDCD